MSTKTISRKAANTGATTTIESGSGKSGISPKQPAKTIRQVRKHAHFNIMYHAAREAWLDSVHRWLMFIVICLGAASVVTVLNPMVAAICGAATAVFGALDLTFDLSNRARLHALHRHRYAELLSEAEANPDDLARIDARMVAIYADEEPMFNALAAMCNNQAEHQVYDKDHDILFVPPIHRILRNVIRFDGVSYGEVAN
jgi:hypothetical protein